jgi:DnaJ-class molecular chaperone
MDEKFSPIKYGMMVCPLCDGYGHIRYPSDVRVCQNCGGFGYIREEAKSKNQSLHVGSRIVKE